MDWCLWATTTWTNNRKSVVAINLHACLLLLEGQGLGYHAFFSPRLAVCRGGGPKSTQDMDFSAGAGRFLEGRPLPTAQCPRLLAQQMTLVTLPSSEKATGPARWTGPLAARQTLRAIPAPVRRTRRLEGSRTNRSASQWLLAGEVAPLRRSPPRPIIDLSTIDKSSTRRPKDPRQGCAVGRVVSLLAGARGRGCDASFGPLFWVLAMLNKDGHGRASCARRAGLELGEWAAAGLTEDKRWDSGWEVHVVRRPASGVRRQVKSKFRPLSLVLLFGRRILWDGDGDGKSGEQQDGWLVPGPPPSPVVFDQFSRRIIIASWWAAGGCGCGWAWPPPAEIASAVPFMQRHAPVRIRFTADRGGSEVTRRISTESTDFPAPGPPPSTRRTKEQKPPRKLGTWTVEAYRTWKPRTCNLQPVPRLQRKPFRSTSASPRLSPPARSLFLDARPIATRNKIQTLFISAGPN